MACDSCGAKKGHLSGCPLAKREKAGGPTPQKGGTKGTAEPTGRKTPRSCLSASEDDTSKHPDFACVCMEPVGHSDKHTCGACTRKYS